MAIKPEQVEKVAELAKIAIDEATLNDVTQRLSTILDFVDQLQSANTEGVAPLSHPIDGSQFLRADDVTEPNLRDDFQQIAPATEAGLYLVPKVID